MSAIIIHVLFPNAVAVDPKVPPMTSMFVPIPKSFPVNAITTYLNIQPTTHE